MRIPLTAALCLAFFAGAPPLRGQQARPDSAAVASAARTLTRDLRQYVTAQENYYAAHRTYAGAAQATALKPSTDVTVIVLTFSSKGHNAVAIHRDVPGLVCAIWVGQKDAPPLDDRAEEGEPTCRLPGQPISR